MVLLRCPLTFCRGQVKVAEGYPLHSCFGRFRGSLICQRRGRNHRRQDCKHPCAKGGKATQSSNLLLIYSGIHVLVSQCQDLHGPFPPLHRDRTWTTASDSVTQGHLVPQSCTLRCISRTARAG